MGEVFAGTVEVRELITDLIDFTAVRLVQASLRYLDAANGIDEREDFVISATRRPQNLPWQVQIKTGGPRSYSLSATYFMTDGSRRTVGPIDLTDEVLILEPPAA